MDVRETIKYVAETYIGQKELKANSGFVDPEFQKKMEAVGFDKGEAWCSLFAELVWSESYGRFDSTIIYNLQKYFSDSAVQTWNNFKKSKQFKTSNKPEIGDLAVWQKYNDGKAHWSGHVAVVTEPDELWFWTVEGNTNNIGGREGDGVYKRQRDYNFNVDNGLRLLGFIKPIEA